MKSLADFNELFSHFTLPPSIYIESDDGLLVKPLHQDDDTSFIITIYSDKDGQRYREGIVVFPWELEASIRRKFIVTVQEFLQRMRRL